MEKNTTHSDNHISKHHAHSHAHAHGLVKNMFMAFIINACFTVIEFIGGIVFNSTAILADAIHDLGDTIALGSSIIIEKKSYSSRNKVFTFGYRRLSILSALVNGIILISGSIIMLTKSIERVIEPQEVNSEGMIIMGVLGIIFNGLAVFRMKKSHQGINAKALYYHLLEDALGWVVILIGAICIYFFDIPILDPILSIALCLFIGYNAIKLLIPIYKILMESAPDGVKTESIQKEVERIEGVIEMHDIHLWSLDGEYHILTAHILVSSKIHASSHSEIKNQVIQLLRKYNILHTTLEIENEGEQCLSDCC